MKEVAETLWKKIKEITQEENPHDVVDLYALVTALNEIWKVRRSAFFPWSQQLFDEPKSE